MTKPISDLSRGAPAHAARLATTASESLDQVLADLNSAKDEAVRADDGKLRFDLIPPEVEIMLAAVLTEGAKKYASRNWEKGMDWDRCVGSLGRHLSKWKLGEIYDDESGLPHLAHVLTNVAFLLTYELRGIKPETKFEVPKCSRDTIYSLIKK